MESPRFPAALASLRKAGLKIVIMTTSFFLGRKTIKAAPNSGIVAGPAFYRAVAASGERDRILRDSFGSRRRARRPGDSLICARAAPGQPSNLRKNVRRLRRHRNCAFDKINPRQKGGFREAGSRFHIGAYATVDIVARAHKKHNI
jgi:hypothetical protein